jgi:hypothetical protein
MSDSAAPYGVFGYNYTPSVSPDITLNSSAWNRIPLNTTIMSGGINSSDILSAPTLTFERIRLNLDGKYLIMVDTSFGGDNGIFGGEINFATTCLFSSNNGTNTKFLSSQTTSYSNVVIGDLYNHYLTYVYDKTSSNNADIEINIVAKTSTNIPYGLYTYGLYSSNIDVINNASLPYNGERIANFLLFSNPGVNKYYATIGVFYIGK